MGLGLRLATQILFRIQHPDDPFEVIYLATKVLFCSSTESYDDATTDLFPCYQKQLLSPMLTEASGSSCFLFPETLSSADAESVSRKV